MIYYLSHRNAVIQRAFEMFIKSMYWVAFLIAVFFAADGMLTSDIWESLFAGFLIFGIVMHHSMMNEKVIN